MRQLLLSLLAMLTTATAAAASISNTKFDRPLSRNGMRKLLSNARRMEQEEDNRGEQGEQAVEDYIHGYSLQFVECVPDEAIQDANGDDRRRRQLDEYYGDDGFYGVVFFRLCPNESCGENGSCNSSDDAHFAITLQSYVQLYLEDQAENYQWDDDMMGYVDNFDTCELYEAENNGGLYYYVGPTCTEDGLDIRLGVFSDSSCSVESSDTFASISGGKSLPFENGGLVSNQCVACAYYDDDGNYEVKDLCMDLYDYAPLKCESWPMQHYYWDAMVEVYKYGQDTTGCKKIEHLLRKPPQQVSPVASVIVLSLLVLGTLGGAYYYTIWWSKSK